MSFLHDGYGRRKYLTASERSAFLSAAQRQEPKVRTFCRVLAYTGARISEVLNLTPAHIDCTAQVIVFETLKKRRRGSFRAVPVPVELLAELNKVHRINRARINPDVAHRQIWPWCRTTAWHHVKVCMALAKIDGSQASPKGLRHSFAIAALQAHVPINLVKKWLGHARLSTTEIYADAMGPEEQRIAKRFWSRF